MMKTEIERALTSGVNTRQGTVVVVPRALAPAMRDLGLIGENNGLTRQGSILAGRLRDAALEAAFG
jgi:hypothetical protein